MQSIKTGIVVALLLAVSYGAFKALNAPDPELPPELADWVSQENLDNYLDVGVPVQKRQPKFDSELAILPTVSPIDVALPSVESSALPRADSQNPNSHALGTPASTQNPLSVDIDGPAIKLTALSYDESNSLVPETFPTPAPLTAGKSGTDQGSLLANSNSNAFPSIPLPVDPAPQMNNSLLNDPRKSAVGALPLLADSSSPPSETDSRSNGAAVPPQALEQFSIARQQALKQAADGKLKEALVSLTRYYNSPEISHEENADLLAILDALAREVIYSQRHLLRAPFAATVGDTVASVAAQHHITPELLKSINLLGDSQVLIQGQQLKIVEGPFRAEVDLTRSEITLFLKDMYACRFPVTVGTDQPPKIGSFEVAGKQTDRTYYGLNNKVIKAAEPSNPYGGYWIDLGREICLHGSPEMAASDLSKAGCISLSPIDARDTYIMLTPGSQVVIR